MNKSRITFGIIFILLVSAAVWLFLSDASSPQRQMGGMRAVSIMSDKVAMREFSDIVEALGTVKARESVTITSNVADTVAKIHFDDGDVVQKGDLLVELENSEEKAKLLEAEANVKEANLQHERIQNLVKSGNASTAALDAQKRAKDEARFRLAAERARFRDMRITAPFNGVLGLRQISEGTFLSTNTTITTLDAIDTIKLDFHVPERFVSTMQSGQLIQASVEAYPGEVFEGRLKTVDSRVDPVTRSVLVRAEIPNADHKLRPGMLMVVSVISKTWNGLSVPEEAVVHAGSKNYVFVVEDDIANRKEVTLGIRRPGYVEVTSGLSEGDRVVTRGTFRLGAMGQKVMELSSQDSTVGAGQ